MNVINLVGRITKDAELRTYGKGKEKGKLTNFTIAVRRNAEETDFLQCTAFGELAEIIVNYVKKGDPIGITGRLQNNNYEDNDGNMVYRNDIMVNNISLLGSRSNSEQEDDKKPNKKYHR